MPPVPPGNGTICQLIVRQLIKFINLHKSYQLSLILYGKLAEWNVASVSVPPLLMHMVTPSTHRNVVKGNTFNSDYPMAPAETGLLGYQIAQLECEIIMHRLEKLLS